MNIFVTSQELKKAAARLSGCVSDRATSFIGLRSEGACLQLMSTDRILSVHTNIAAEIEKGGTVFAPGRLLLDLVRELPDARVNIRLEKSVIVIETQDAGSFLMRIPVVENAEWFDRPSIEGSNSLKIEAERLQYIINQVQFCISTDSPRAFGTVGFMHRPEPKKLRLVGTDSFRLSYCDLEIEPSCKFLPQAGISLSKRALTEIVNVAKDAQNEIELKLDEEQTALQISSEDCTLLIRLSAVKFPNYQGVLPTASMNLVKVSKPIIQNAMRRVLLAADKSKALQLSFSNSSLTLTSKTIGSSEGTESIRLDGYRGADKNLMVNGRFLSEVFSVTNADQLTVQFKSSDEPIVIAPEQEVAACKSIHILVPIKETT